MLAGLFLGLITAFRSGAGFRDERGDQMRRCAIDADGGDLRRSGERLGAGAQPLAMGDVGGVAAGKGDPGGKRGGLLKGAQNG